MSKPLTLTRPLTVLIDFSSIEEADGREFLSHTGYAEHPKTGADICVGVAGNDKSCFAKLDGVKVGVRKGLHEVTRCKLIARMRDAKDDDGKPIVDEKTGKVKRVPVTAEDPDDADGERLECFKLGGVVKRARPLLERLEPLDDFRVWRRSDEETLSIERFVPGEGDAGDDDDDVVVEE